MTITFSVIDFEHVNASWTTLSLIPFKKSLAGSTFSRELSCQNIVANMLNITSEMRKILANLVLGSRNELHYTKKWSFPLRTSSVNATKSAVLKKSLMENFIFYAVWDKGSSI